jgi:hypothetical protein
MLVIGDHALLGMQPPPVSVQITCSGALQLLRDISTKTGEQHWQTVSGTQQYQAEQNIRIGGPAGTVTERGLVTLDIGK